MFLSLLSKHGFKSYVVHEDGTRLSPLSRTHHTDSLKLIHDASGTVISDSIASLNR